LCLHDAYKMNTDLITQEQVQQIALFVTQDLGETSCHESTNEIIYGYFADIAGLETASDAVLLEYFRRILAEIV
jgi:hypothetical protein